MVAAGGHAWWAGAAMPVEESSATAIAEIPVKCMLAGLTENGMGCDM